MFWNVPPESTTVRAPPASTQAATAPAAIVSWKAPAISRRTARSSR